MRWRGLLNAVLGGLLGGAIVSIPIGGFLYLMLTAAQNSPHLH